MKTEKIKKEKNKKKFQIPKLKIRRKQKSKTQKVNNNHESETENQIIAIWGSSGSGKTTLGVKIAKELSNKKKNVILIHDDIFCPVIPIVFPNLNKEHKDKSLGKILTAPNIDQGIILDNSITIKGNNHMVVIGHQKGENPLTYPEYVRERAVDLLLLLRHMADYIIIDCSSVITESLLTITALEFADKVIRLTTADFKGLSYFKSNLPLLMDNKFRIDSHLKIVSNTRDFQAEDTINDITRGSGVYIPNAIELERQYMEGSLLNELYDKESIDYKNAIENIIKEALNG